MHARLNHEKQYPTQVSIEYHRDNSIVVSTSRCGFCSYSAERTQVRFLVIPFFALADMMPSRSLLPNAGHCRGVCIHFRLDAKDQVCPCASRRIRLCLENGQVLEPPDRRYRACLEDTEPLGSGRNTGSLPKGVCFLIQPLNPLLPSLNNNTMVIAIADSVNCKFSLALT